MKINSNPAKSLKVLAALAFGRLSWLENGSYRPPPACVPWVVCGNVEAGGQRTGRLLG